MPCALVMARPVDGTVAHLAPIAAGRVRSCFSTNIPSHFGLPSKNSSRQYSNISRQRISRRIVTSSDRSSHLSEAKAEPHVHEEKKLRELLNRIRASVGFDSIPWSTDQTYEITGTDFACQRGGSVWPAAVMASHCVIRSHDHATKKKKKQSQDNYFQIAAIGVGCPKVWCSRPSSVIRGDSRRQNRLMFLGTCVGRQPRAVDSEWSVAAAVDHLRSVFGAHSFRQDQRCVGPRRRPGLDSRLLRAQHPGRPG